MRATDTHLLMSCSKSLDLDPLRRARRPRPAGADDLVTDHLPELAGTCLGRLPPAAHPRHARRHRVGLRRRRVHDPRRLRLPHARPARRDPGRHGDLDPHHRARARTRHGEGPFRYCSLATDVLGWVLVAGRRSAVPGAVLARGLVADRRRARRRDHARPRRLRDRRGRHLHDASRPGAVRAAVPRGRPHRRRAAGSGRLDRARLRSRRRADRGVPLVGHRPTRRGRTPSTTTSGGSSTGRAASTRGSA